MTVFSGLPILLLSDFGLEDPYVGQVKGVLLRLAPALPVVDFYHQIPPFDVACGAFLLARCRRHMPAAVWFCVVDPGVGTCRRGLVVAVEGSYFVGPDNGLLTPVLDCPGALVHGLVYPPQQLACTSATFHGRDLFAPAVADLALGRTTARLGAIIQDPVRLTEATWERTASGWRTRVMLVDRYGNLVTALPATELGDGLVRVLVAGQPCGGRVTTFAEVPPGQSAVLVGSLATWEVVVNQGSAARLFQVGRGAVVILERC